MIRRPIQFGSSLAVLGSVLGFPVSALGLNPNHDCNFCHITHSAPGPSLNVNADIEVMCLTCHDPATGTATLKADVHSNKQGSTHAAFSMTCVNCHDPHSDKANWLGGTNLKLIGTDADSSGYGRINTPSSGIRDVVFESLGSDLGQPTLHSFADNDQDVQTSPLGHDYDGICEVCHTAANHHRNTGDPDPHHAIGRTCTSCHPHDAGFAPTGGSCTECHNSPQDNGDATPPGGRRAIVGEFNLVSHHVDGASLQDADCEVCHEMTQHQGGFVRLKNVDDPTNPAAVVLLNADPSTNSTEAAKLTPFCLACHDADAAGGSAPFTGGATPAVIDSAVWAGTSHNLGSISCFGDGQFGCHASGHGSEKRKLLTPFAVAPTPPENAEEEEGFCFNCHDTNGPALSDVQAAFAPSTRWVAAAVGDFNNINLNDRHDIQHGAQSVSGAKIECTDCHDPHTATNGNPLKADPDPTDGRLPGTGQILAGADFETEWCLDCHDGSFPLSVTAPSTPLNDVLSSYQTDSMGLAGGNAVLKPGYGWADNDVVPCLACHTRDHVSPKQNLFQLMDLVQSKDGTTDIPSDTVGFNYEVTDNSVKSPPINGHQWCNTCHTSSMGSKKSNCFACHYHGSRF